MSTGRAARLSLLLAIGLLLLSPTAHAQAPTTKAAANQGLAAQSITGQGFGNTGPNDRRPLDIEADDGIEWQQNNSVYIAHGNARATRGGSTVYADTLIAHYRPIAGSGQQKEQSASASTGSTEIYRIEADGNVRLKTETQTVYGDHAVYDVDRATAVVTGKHLRLITPRDTVTARDTLEWYDQKQIAVARGDAVAIQESKQLAGDVLTAQVVKPPNEPSRISRIDAQGHVLVSTLTDIARGASGVYNVDTGIATLAGGVTITRGDNELRGQYGVVDMNNNVSRLLSAPPGSTERGPVQGLIMPRSTEKNPAADGQGAPHSGRRGRQPAAKQPSPGE